MHDFYNFQVVPLKSTSEIEAKLSGENRKGLLVILSADEENEELNQFVAKVLKAAGFDVPEDVHFLKLTSSDGFSFSLLSKKNDIQSVISFGFSPKFLGLNWNLANYSPFLYENRKYLFADNLAEIQKDKKLKGKLWKCLQAMYL